MVELFYIDWKSGVMKNDSIWLKEFQNRPLSAFYRGNDTVSAWKSCKVPNIERVKHLLFQFMHSILSWLATNSVRISWIIIRNVSICFSICADCLGRYEHDATSIIMPPRVKPISFECVARNTINIANELRRLICRHNVLWSEFIAEADLMEWLGL